MMRKILTIVLFSLSVLMVRAQIVIRGDVYGGGKDGAVGTGYMGEGVTTSTDATDVKLKDDAPQDVTSVTVYSCDSVRTIFGGGKDGRTFGNTSVNIAGSNTNVKIGLWGLKGTVYGGIFGGGEGKTADVFGNSTVTIDGGEIVQKVYGGGCEADLMGHTFVHLRGGNIHGHGVFGGARMANVYGYTHLLIDGENLRNDLIINSVYGGNDVAGDIKTSQTWAWTKPESENMSLPFTPETEGVNNSWNAFVRITSKIDANGQDIGKKIYIGQLFGGGNGDYTYTQNATDETKYDVNIPLTDWDEETESYKSIDGGKTYSGLNDTLTLGKTYLEILGGSIVYAYGGGNNATVTENTVICVDNPTNVVNSIKDKNGKQLLTTPRFKEMGINLGFSYPSSDAFQIGRFFGGNNKAEMAIRPTWNLISGKIRNLYSGGNMGDMTSPEGLLVDIPETSKIKIDNIYGGCRMADVMPKLNGTPVEAHNLTDKDAAGNQKYFFPDGFSARLLISGGDINNVYGGNDVSGKVYGGNAVGIHTSIRGDIYGGGNGSYPYTDNPLMENDDTYGDLYYKISDVPGAKSSVEALNTIRPNAEQVSIRLLGTEDKPTIIHGGVFCGGNSATIMSSKENPKVELKIGSYVIADSVFLGNNGANMVRYNEKDDANLIAEGVLRTMKSELSNGKQFNSIDLTNGDEFASYMEGAIMTLMPSVVFDSKANGDGQDYIDYSTSIGSFFCGGNVGSMKVNGKTAIDFKHDIIIYNKVVGGCNQANVAQTEFNAAYAGGLLGTPDKDNNKLQLTFEGVKIQPKRWKDATKTELIWNTITADTTSASGYKEVDPVTTGATAEAPVTSTPEDKARRLNGGNIYGGCYNSGHVNGNVIINLKASIIDKDRVFDVVEYEGSEPKLYGNDSYKITKRNSGVILDEQGMDALGRALNVLGAGYGEDSEVWGSTTINLNKGYTFQIFGGGEKGAVGKKDSDGNYTYNEAYSTYINLNGSDDLPGVARNATDDSPDMAECEFIYGGGFEGIIAGNTHVNLGNGRIFNSFAGSCDADILGHTETYVGLQADGTTLGFPWIRDHIYGGNDLGGKICSTKDFSSSISTDAVKSMVYNIDKNLEASAYMEYTQGHLDYIFGGCYGDYDYEGEYTSVSQQPWMESAVVNFRPNADSRNAVSKIFGAGQGASKYNAATKNKMQNRSYILIDIADTEKNLFADMEVFGAGENCGVGMGVNIETAKTNADKVTAAAVIDLARGRIGAAYGGSLDEGVTRRTVVNVPEKSTIVLENIFGGAFGNHILPPCDVYEANVNYRSGDARVNGAIYGGNNNVRRTLYAKLNVAAPVMKENGYSGTVYGAGKGMETWAEYTEVNLEAGANVWEVYGGGEMGNVLNAESVQAYMQAYKDQPADKLVEEDSSDWSNADRWDNGQLKSDYAVAWKQEWKAAWTLGDGYYTPGDDFSGYVEDGNTNLSNPLVRKAEMDDRTDHAVKTYTYNTNVIVHEGAYVGNYAYAGGYGDRAKRMSGSVYGTTYFALLGGTVNKDIYAAGTAGSVEDIFGVGPYNADSGQHGFTASANAYIKGGMVRNVYGGGWRGGVGYHNGDIDTDTADDIPGEAHVVIGDINGTSFTNGIPAVNRNVYGGGEGGGIFGTAYVTINNGRIGYRYKNTAGEDEPADWQYVENLDDVAEGDNLLDESGNVFGGGYVANSYVDTTDVKVYGGIIRGGLYGGGEVGPVGRGTVREDASTANAFINGSAKIYKGGETHVALYKGHVMRDVFGGGRGFDNWGGEGYMTDEEKETMDLSSKGYVFGSTDVRILGGEVGTEEGVAKEFGNVFGGGNVGYVYSATGTKKEKYDNANNTNTYYYYDSSDDLTEDCRVLVMPYCQVTSTVTINGTSYAVGEYVPTEELNRLKNKDADKSTWDCLNIDGVIIRNAIFAGGNVTIGSDRINANTKTVLGNVTASIVDVYNRDLVTVGTEHVGGLYGDGNLTLVDGYRELNITNYGTDYYGMSDNISLEDYYRLTDRERAYFELKYKCITAYTYTNPQTHVSHAYTVGESISEETYNSLADEYKGNWERAGFCSIYAGRLMNTIQRADFAGIFGSRMVLQGAKDRVPSVADKTDYTVNRVGEVSLNQVKSTVAGEPEASHGNYFGIYSIVNYMGALTSDVNFYNTVRTTNNASYAADGTTTFYQWKEEWAHERKRNNGTSPNTVALASGVYLELTTEKSTGNTVNTKDWGYITGVAQLELINVKTGLGGGYVYAKNQHGVRSESGNDHTILSPYNMATADGSHAKAVTNKLFVYSATDLKEVQTSGNFVHNLKQIIDDCYPTTNAYSGANAAPAHYWYIRGTSYVYDQYITAYTGITNAYSQMQNIPLNINASSYGRLTLEDVKPNLYAYYATTEASSSARTPLQNTDENGANYSVLINNEKTYYLNDPITYWDYIQLSEADQRHFVRDTYVSVIACQVGGKDYPAGTVILPSEYEALKDANPTVYNTAREEDVDFDYAFRLSNNLSHEKGYVISYSVNNPSAWDSGETDATYSPNTTGVFGQHSYNVGDIITKDIYDEGSSVASQVDASTQATMVTCYVATEDLSFAYGGRNYRYTTGSPIVKEDFDDATWSSLGTKVQQAQTCISTLEFVGAEADKSLLYGELVWPARYDELVAAYAASEGVTTPVARTAVNGHLSNAYYCQKEGLFGGSYFEAGTQYSALKAWSSLSEEDRKNFHFNYDALNLLVDPDYTGNIPLYDNNKEPLAYSSQQPVDYEAIYEGTANLTYVDNNGVSKTIAPGQVLSREEYEAMPNEQYHYAPLTITEENYSQCYVVKVSFTRGDTPYTVGQTIDGETYSYLSSDQKEYIDIIEFTEADVNKTYYYCRQSYQVNSYNGEAVKDELTETVINKGGVVQVGVLISDESYKGLPNNQGSFSISGTSPQETTTIYVARGSDIFDLQKDRVITVIFKYDYAESDESGMHIEPITEQHIVNIHIHFESGVPTIDKLHSPAAALPGDFVGLKQPNVKPGAYELLGGGWEIFTNEEDAERHRNGTPFTNATPVYWYQDGQYLAYYAKTYLGKTYSNYVQFNVANYHDIKAVMADTEHHLYVDNPEVKRNSKIYLNDYEDDAKSGIDLLKDFYDLSVSGLPGHSPLNSRVRAGSNIDFLLHADQRPSTYSNWTPIGGTADACFNGTLHGEGYTISGLNNSLFGHLCGHVYNLGVQGTFTSAGVADTGDGYVENCWVKTSGTPDGSVYAVFGNPSDESENAWRQIENCYYATPSGDYKTTGATHGLARKMTDKQFYNGEVAYDLNGFYLKKRYNDQAADGDKVETYNYVEDRYSNPDFIYSDGEIPTVDEVRSGYDEDGNQTFTPRWPDDYLFFGQTLNYGHNSIATNNHQEKPSHLEKNGDCHTLVANGSSNRVYRAPAYFSNKRMGMFHFNPYAVMAARSSDGLHEAYPRMTAVDFTGVNDDAYGKGLDSDGVFFRPVLDSYIDLAGVLNADLTQNLLIYSPTGELNTNRIILANYFKEPAITEDTDEPGYRKVARQSTADIHGHIVYRNGSSLTASNDHLLVDKQDFNAPLAYTFTSDKRMWYQRKPEKYVTKASGTSEGWEDVSLPFTAELVTTQQKGEITHFYSRSLKGHEYWLRELSDITGSGATVTAALRYPEAVAGAGKTYQNTFLWDYYYQANERHDQNTDEYQTYYNSPHIYNDYPMGQAGVPYVIGFPSSYYYEFDLSGSFIPKYTATTVPERLDKQTVTFASAPGATIGVSDDEQAAAISKYTKNGFAYRPNYLTTEIATGDGYLLNDAGTAYDVTTAATTLLPFRPYFAKQTADVRTRSIVFGDADDTELGGADDTLRPDGQAEGLIVKPGRHKIVVESRMNDTTEVRILLPTGITLTTFSIEPGEKVETRIINQGVYIVQTTDGKYNKKLAVR